MYGAEFLEPSKTMLNRMQTFWNWVCRWITNSFYATNILVLSAEGCFAPMSIYAKQMRLMTAMRIVTAIQENNIATAMLPQSFPLKRDHRPEMNRGATFDMNKSGMRPKVWSSTCATTFQTRLPIEEFAARALKMLPVGQMPVRPTRLLQVTPEDAEGHFNVRATVRKIMHQKWVDELYLQYYEYRPPYRECWNFMTLPKFMARRVNQMRANKSYLNAQTDWSNQDRDHTCPRCGQESETFLHVVQCPSLEGDRRGKNMQTFNIALDLGLWKGNKKGIKLWDEFSSYVMRNGINFPVKMRVFPFTHNAQLAS